MLCSYTGTLTSSTGFVRHLRRGWYHINKSCSLLVHVLCGQLFVKTVFFPCLHWPPVLSTCPLYVMTIHTDEYDVLVLCSVSISCLERTVITSSRNQDVGRCYYDYYYLNFNLIIWGTNLTQVWVGQNYKRKWEYNNEKISWCLLSLIQK